MKPFAPFRNGGARHAVPLLTPSRDSDPPVWPLAGIDQATSPVLDAPADTTRDLAAFGLVGLALLALFCGFVARFPLLRYFPGPGVTISFYEIFGKDWVQGVWWYVSAFCAAFLLLGAAALLSPRRPTRSAIALVFGIPALISLALIYMYPATAMDVIHYYAAARTLWIYGQNPMLVPVDAHPFIVGVSFPDRASPYGPLWQIITGPTTVLAGNHWAWGVLGMKLIGAIAFLGTAWLVYAIVRRLHPGRALFATVLFAFNPFILFRAVGNGHNDIVMVAFMLLAIYFLVSEQWLWVFPALAASVLVKYISLLLGPPILLYLFLQWRARGDRRILQDSVASMLLAGGFTLVLVAPFWSPQAFLHSADLALQAITSTPLVLAVWLQDKVPPGTALDTATWITRVIFAAIYVLLLLVCRPRPERLISCCILILFAYATVATTWFRPWYFLWFVPLTVLPPSRWWVAFGIVSSFMVNLAEMVEYYRSNMAWLTPHELALIAAPVVVQFLLPTIVLVVALILTRSPDLRQVDTAVVSGLPEPVPV